MSDSHGPSPSDSHGPSPVALGVGVALLIIFLAGPADGLIKLAIFTGICVWAYKGNIMGGGDHH